MKKILLFISFLIFLCACESTPKGVLSKSDMEDVLYDYYMMMGMLNDMGWEEKQEKSQLYIDAVFDKHGITQAEFDSSFVWYNRHMKELNKIYTNIKEKIDKQNKELQLQNGNNDMMAVFSNGGDTTNIWGLQKLMILRNKKLLNKESFTIKADTSFHKEDTYIFMCKSNMVLENRNERKEYVTIGLTLSYKNGKTTGITRQSFSSGNMQISLIASDTVDVTKVTGFIYFHGSPSYRSIAFIDDIRLVRMHKQKVEPVTDIPKDTATSPVLKDSDSIRIDTTVHQKHLSPDEIRLRTITSKKIEIKEAPEVRTPNRFGKRKTVKAKK